jgi:hypothetical protein
VGGGAEDAGRVAGGGGAGLGDLSEETAEARRDARDEERREAGGGDAGAVDPLAAPVSTQASFSRKRASKLSKPSTTRSIPSRRSRTFRGPTSATTGSTVTSALTRAIRRAAATAFGSPSRTSASSKRAWRWRFESSTTSRSTIRRKPTPARARRLADSAPRPPQPATRTRAARTRTCPSAPKGRKRSWRE